ncbi:hypothetical protein [Salipiger abyssi]|uniref:hypothetical protein n=1 Tax=Salipiger abyssi TaxID=1250539 RepID=UPI0012EB25EF|nr:hypothetical protein [Salipiger abyssi]MBN9886783.1 hypothetical protein [Salipiger abyssi]
MTKQIASKIFTLLSAAPARPGAKPGAGITRADSPWTDPASSQYRDIASCL